ncbi:MAG: hypothetical protein WC406_13450 [Methanoregula sp.]
MQKKDVLIVMEIIVESEETCSFGCPHFISNEDEEHGGDDVTYHCDLCGNLERLSCRSQDPVGVQRTDMCQIGESIADSLVRTCVAMQDNRKEVI